MRKGLSLPATQLLIDLEDSGLIYNLDPKSRKKYKNTALFQISIQYAIAVHNLSFFQRAMYLTHKITKRI